MSPATSEGMTRIFEELRKDHDIQRHLIGLLLDTQGDSDDRREIFARLKDELERHALCEERHFYAELLGADLGADKARHSVAEHKELDDLIEDLEEMEMSSPHWLPKAKTLCERLTHHLDEEEHEVFQIAGKVLSDEQKTKLGSAYRRDMIDESEIAA